MKGQRQRLDACARIEPLIPMYVDGELNTRRAEAVRKHLDICPACAAQAREMEELSRLVARTAGEHMPACAKDSPASGLGAVAQPPPSTSQTRHARRMGWRLGGALAALVLMCGVLLMPGGPLNPLANAPSHDAAPPVGGLDGGNWDGMESPGTNAPGDAPDDNEMMPEGPDKGDPIVYHLFRPDWEPKPDAPGGDSPSYGGEGDSSDDGYGDVMDGVPEGPSEALLSRLHGEWENKEMKLYLSTLSMTFGLIMEDGVERYGTFFVYDNVLFLVFDDGTGIKFEVLIEGDELWLTKLP